MTRYKSFVEDLDILKQYSTIEGVPGINRLAFTDQEWRVREYLVHELQKLGASITSDAFGNIIAHLKGRNPSLPTIIIGSHTDSVPQGGHFDGLYGILAGIEIIRQLKADNIQLQHPLELILFTCEESSRFGVATLGSQAMLGHLTQEKLHQLKDKTGLTLYEVLQQRNLQPHLIGQDTYQIPARIFLEIHIEQGLVLESHQKPIGIVTGIAAPTRNYIHIHGKADHSGATPMNLRHDALCGAAEIILAVERIAKASPKQLVATVGIVQATPGVMNVIPGAVTLGLDVRSIYGDTKVAAMTTIQEQIQSICDSRDLTFTIEPLSDDTPVSIKSDVVDMMELVAKKHNFSYMTLPSGAGHDAMHWADYTDVGMVFIPCKDGISHNPAELASLDNMIQGIEYLKAVLLHIDNA